MRWIALSAPWGSRVHSSLFPSAQFVKRSEYLRNTEMVAKCKRGKFRLVRVENLFITRPDLTPFPPPPLVVPPLCYYGAVYSCASYCWLSALRKIGSRTYRFILGLRSVIFPLPSVGLDLGGASFILAVTSLNETLREWDEEKWNDCRLKKIVISKQFFLLRP